MRKFEYQSFRSILKFTETVKSWNHRCTTF